MNGIQFLAILHQLPTQLILLVSLIYFGIVVVVAIIRGQSCSAFRLLSFSISLTLFLASTGVIGGH